MTATAPTTAETDRRLTLYPKALLGALAVAFLFVIVAGSGSDGTAGRVGGDFPAFYSAGTIVADGNIDNLWDPVTQQAAQADLLGDEDGFIMFPYAPHVAGAYAGLAQLPFRMAYAVHTLAMVGFLVAALHLLRPVIPTIDRWWWLTLAGVLAAYPVFVGIGGGQNTALTLFLVAAIWRSLADGHDGLAGIAAAVLLFRPQYALPLIGLMFLGGHWRAVRSAAIGGLVVYAINTALLGPLWLTTWLDQVRPLLEADADVNAVNEIAPIGFLHALLGTDSLIALVFGALVSAAAIGVLVWTWWRSSLDLGARMAITTAGLLLIGPHTIYYDSSLLLFSVLLLLDRRLMSPALVAVAWAAGLIHLGKGLVDASPLALVVVGAFTAIVWLVTRDPQNHELRVLPIQDSWSPR
jgi:alpha-1,2-mannosyltransferase